MPDAWDPGQYDKFAAERAQPFWDLAALLEDRPIRRAVDLGCGTGELTAALAARRGIADMTGIDSSPAMLAAGARPASASRKATSAGGRRAATTTSSSPTPACSGCPTTRRGRPLVGGPGPGGQLAVQVPTNADHPSHRVAAEVAASEPFRSAMGGPPPPDQVAANVLAPEQYAILLDHLGAARQHVRLQVYGHVLDRSADVVEWVRGTSLTRFASSSRRTSSRRSSTSTAAGCCDAIGDTAPYFYPFKRILFWAAKP